MKVGVWLNNEMVPQEGGGYTYTSSLIKLLDRESFENTEIVFLFYKRINSVNILLNKPIFYLYSHYSIFTFFLKFVRKISIKHSVFYNAITKLIDNQSAKILREEKIDFVYYLNQAQKEIAQMPFIATNWDIAHLSLPGYPEFENDGQLQKRQKWYNVEIKKASAIIVESDAGKEEIIRFLNVNKEKIFVIPFFIGPNKHTIIYGGTDFLQKHKLTPQNYIYYPAQYWKHKNHSTLLKAFKKFIDSNSTSLILVFSGSDKGELASIISEIHTLNLKERVRCLEFISNEGKEQLIYNSLCLAMPSFLGPSNLPPLEALELNVPSINSDLTGHHEITQNSALYFDPYSVEDIYAALVKITNNELRKELINNIATVKKNSKFNSVEAKKSLEVLFHYLHKQKINNETN